MTKLNLNEPLEIELTDGRIAAVAYLKDQGFVVLERMGNKHLWDVDEFGNDKSGIMPPVHNAKRKPKEGEWWMCDTGSSDGNGPIIRPFLHHEWGSWYISESICDRDRYSILVNELKPLYPMVPDPSYKE